MSIVQLAMIRFGWITALDLEHSYCVIILNLNAMIKVMMIVTSNKTIFIYLSKQCIVAYFPKKFQLFSVFHDFHQKQ